MNSINAADLIAVDEMGCLTGMSRSHGYAEKGKRAVSFEPAERGTRLSLIGAMSLGGFLGGLEVIGTVNGDVFEGFVEQVLMPHLGHGKIVLLDNITFHHKEKIKNMIEARGAIVKFLPSYSPEFNPIEECWSKIKAWLRKKSTRSVESLQSAIDEAIQQVTVNDIEGWFNHAGYHIQ